MFGKLTQKIRKNFNIIEAVGTLVTSYFDQRESEGKVNEAWTALQRSADEQNLSIKKRRQNIAEQFISDVHKSYSMLTPGVLVIFNYISLKGDNKTYFAIVIAARGQRGVYNNKNTKNTLMSCFVINEDTDLNTLAAVVDVLLDQEIDSLWKEYKPLTNDNEQDNEVQNRVNQKREKKKLPRLDESGMRRLFPTTDFRTFTLNKGMKTMYKVNING